MIEVGVLTGNSWTAADWPAIAQTSVEAAVAATPYAALALMPLTLEVAVKLSGDDEVQTLNRDFRDKDKPTNILSFPQTPPDLLLALSTSAAGAAAGDDAEAILGDMILAGETCIREAADKKISLEQHVTHLIVHGTLHLLGYDHIEEAEASDMETLETQILAGLGVPDPYGDRD